MIQLIFYFRYNYFFLNMLTIKNNIIVFKKLNILYFYNSKFIFLFNNFFDYKYNWLNTETSAHNDFYFNVSDFNSKKYNYKLANLKKNSTDINNIIKLKKTSSVFKKNNDYNYLILNYLNIIRYNFIHNKSLDYFDNTPFFKNFDLNKKIKLIFKNNRNILKLFFNLKYFRKFSLSKNIISLINFKKNKMIFNLENNILNILMKSNFFLSEPDCIWFLKNGLISVNYHTQKNPNFVISNLDIINVCSHKNYYSYYKNAFDLVLNNFFKVNLKLWSINKNKFKNFDTKKNVENYPKWINNYKFFKKSVDLNLEIDYLSMTIIILNYPYNFDNVSYYNLKFINFYLNRLYNWKYIV